MTRRPAGAAAGPTLPTLRWRLMRSAYAISYIGSALCIFAFLGILLGYVVGFRLVVTPSVREGWWYVGRLRFNASDIQVGQYAEVCVPRRAAALGLERGYLGEGSGIPLVAPGCRDGVYPVIKRVVAVGGDVVDISAAGMRVNGVPMNHSAQLGTDAHGRVIPAVPSGRYRVAPMHFWLLGDTVESWDSRYWGPIGARAMFGPASFVI